MKVLDLFCGAGGLSRGFSKQGFEVTGVDSSDDAEATFKANNLGKFLNRDLSESFIEGEYDIILGGPPCKPWSSVNTTKRSDDHEDYQLVAKFFDHVIQHNPRAFLLENVPPLKGDRILEQEINRLEQAANMGITGDFSVHSEVVKYSDYGAATDRARLIVFGSREAQASQFFENLKAYEEPPDTVGDRIGHLPDSEDNPIPNHEWPNLTTIEKYEDYYEEGKFGWYILEEDEPAPSFGNVTKTYILPPAGLDREPRPRVISVLEAALIMGFEEDFEFPTDLGLSNRYQLIVDSVNPVFSRAAANALCDTLADSASS